jgi:hypothetical protein
MQLRRVGHTLTTFLDGRALVAGGEFPLPWFLLTNGDSVLFSCSLVTVGPLTARTAAIAEANDQVESVTVQALEGTIDLRLERTVTVSMPGGATATITNDLQILNAPDSAAAITIRIQDQVATISPGESQSVPFEEITNNVPIVSAGADQTHMCSSPTGTPITLDGTVSFDPDGNPITFTWTGPFPEGGGAVTGVTPTVTLPFGTSIITLVVNDGLDNSDPDTVAITTAVRVEGFESPLADLVPAGDPVPLPDKAFKLNSTLPLKLRLFCGSIVLTDTEVPPPKIVALVREGNAPVDLAVIDPDPGQANDTGPLFRFSENRRIYNLSTKHLRAGTYTITMVMPDDRSFDAGFVLK